MFLVEGEGLNIGLERITPPSFDVDFELDERGQPNLLWNGLVVDYLHQYEAIVLVGIWILSVAESSLIVSSTVFRTAWLCTVEF